MHFIKRILIDYLPYVIKTMERMMQGQWIHRALNKWMVSEDYPVWKLVSFERYWRSLIVHQDMPCPKCYFTAKPNNLKVKRATRLYQPFECEQCQTIYNVSLG